MHVAMEELKDRVGTVKDLAREHSKWLLRYTNVHVHKHEQLISIIVATKAYRERVEKGKTTK